MPSDKRDSEKNPAQPLRLVKSPVPAVNEVLGTLVSGSMAQVVLAIAAVLAILAICYTGRLPLMTLCLALLVAFILAPVADVFERWHSPRWASSFIAVVLFLVLVLVIAYLSYSRAEQFIEDLPAYASRIQHTTLRFRQQAEKIQETTQAVLPTPSGGNTTVTVKQQSDLSSLLTSFGGITEIVLSLAFIPFLVYFMLTWRDRAREKTVRLFDPEHQHKVHVALGGIAEMVKAFLVGNLICGLFMATVSTVVFGAMKVPYFYFLGLISGFVSLLPYIGVVLATLPPIIAGVGQLSHAQIIGIIVLVIGLHVFAINVLFPKMIGGRLNLNPLVVTIALLIWGWIWGPVGLLLAIPITGALKIVFDHIESLRPFGAWMED
jgi:predicted PurR-regulated permease PerM